MSGALKGFTGRSAETDPHAQDARLRGRTYAISFDRVWSATVAAVSGGSPRWNVLSADDQTGVIHAEVRTLVSRRAADARIEIGLDDNGQTRLDMRVVMRGKRGDLGGAARIVGSLTKHLDSTLQARPGQILDATRPPSFSS